MTDLRDKIAEIIHACTKQALSDYDVADDVIRNDPEIAEADRATADAIIAALPGMVAPLVWCNSTHHKHSGCMEYAETSAGTYFIIDDNDDFTGLFCDFVTIRDVTWFGTGSIDSHEIMSGVRGDDTTLLRAAANAHHAAAVVGAFTGS